MKFQVLIVWKHPMGLAASSSNRFSHVMEVEASDEAGAVLKAVTQFNQRSSREAIAAKVIGPQEA